MSFGGYLENHFDAACNLQRGILLDDGMVTLVQNVPTNSFRKKVCVPQVKKWMRDYNVLQGIESGDENAIADCFLTYAHSHVRVSHVTENAIRDLYTDLLTTLFLEVRRGWMSAASKLLWCLYPHNIVMYDKFVYQAIVTLQCVDDDISDFPRIGVAPKIKDEADIAVATEFYMNYQAMVRKLHTVHAETITQLLRRNNESYPYEIRIVDKILWMIGNPKIDV